MVLSAFSLFLANRILEKGTVPIADLAERYGKSSSTVRRNISNLNEFLPPKKRFVTTDATVIGRAKYPDLVDAIQSLTISNFATTISERLDYLLALSLKDEFINLSSMYDILEISQSTRKKDRTSFMLMLEQLHFSMNSFPAKGIQIRGREDHYRIRLSEIFAQVIEIDHDDRVVQRLANDPLQKLIYEVIEQCVKRFGEGLSELVRTLHAHDIQLSYSSKKLLFAYYFVARHRAEQGKNLGDLQLPETATYPIFSDAYFVNESENLLANALLVSLDSSTSLDTAHSEATWQLCAGFTDAVEDNIVTTFYTKQALVEEVYRYIYRLKLRHALRYDFYDNKFMTANLSSVSEELPVLFDEVGNAYRTYLEPVITLTEAQLSTLTLILRKHVLANKIAGRNTKKMVLISNAATEQTGFFAELLKYHFDVEVVAVLNIVELHSLHDLDFDVLICFSNRTAKMLHDLEFDFLKVPYFLHHEDIDHLLSLGFSSNSHRKLLTSDLVAKISHMEQEEMASYLRTHYPNVFI